VIGKIEPSPTTILDGVEEEGDEREERVPELDAICVSAPVSMIQS
jgi:hypothetical protein